MPDAPCPSCGAPVSPGVAFCGNCGAPQKTAAAEAPTITAQAVPAVPPVPPPVYPPPAPAPVAAMPQPGYAPAAGYPPGYAPAAPGYAAPAPVYGQMMAPPGYAPGTPAYTPYMMAPVAPNPVAQAGREAFIPRVLAFLIDGFIVGIVAWFLLPFWAFLGLLGGVFGWFFPWILMAVYRIIMESSTGQTLGKMLFSVKVVKEDRTPITSNQAMQRALFVILYGFLIPIILDLMSVSEDGQSMADKWAHTLVMKSG